MVNTANDIALAEYARPILLSLYPMLDRVDLRLPRAPEASTWQGQAKTQYALRLDLIRETTAIIRMHLDGVIEELHLAGSCG